MSPCSGGIDRCCLRGGGSDPQGGLPLRDRGGHRALLLVDSANQNRRRGLSLSDALVEAGEKRLRPIAMTTLAMIFGMLPIAVGLGEGAAFRAPMARAVIGGLVTSTLLTLLVVPVVTSYLDGASTRVRRLLRSRTGSASPGLPTQG